MFGAGEGHLHDDPYASVQRSLALRPTPPRKRTHAPSPPLTSALESACSGCHSGLQKCPNSSPLVWREKEAGDTFTAGSTRHCPIRRLDPLHSRNFLRFTLCGRELWESESQQVLLFKAGGRSVSEEQQYGSFTSTEPPRSEFHEWRATATSHMQCGEQIPR
ncbi:hypothetical protein SKAU_G00325280 [Synaphobranchus kaupii]|uniref:Uncharacterized protein n=1 Tax=Synaphobranchus kaupii TaxID=118154 RepID=A0A9Q1IJ86_SYNKA|nr:hypothetical protein SKAU_G00325280 [Synaphobranchus kaupii]